MTAFAGFSLGLLVISAVIAVIVPNSVTAGMGWILSIIYYVIIQLSDDD